MLLIISNAIFTLHYICTLYYLLGIEGLCGRVCLPIQKGHIRYDTRKADCIGIYDIVKNSVRK